VSQVEFVDGDQIFQGHSILLDIQQAGSAEIYNTITVEHPNYFTDAIILRAGAIIDKVTELYIIIRPPVVGVYNRQPIQTI
jgi:hypothetical protein